MNNGKPAVDYEEIIDKIECALSATKNRDFDSMDWDFMFLVLCAAKGRYQRELELQKERQSKNRLTTRRASG